MRLRLRNTALFAAGVLAATTPISAQDWFEEVAVTNGIDCHFAPGPNYIPGVSQMIAGGAAGDFNRDGWQDLFIVNGGSGPDHLFINDGDGTFTDLAQAWGLTEVHMGAGAAVGDFNGDGWLDLFVSSYGTATGGMTNGAHKLYRNNGNGTFTDIAQTAGVATSDTVRDAFSGSFGDYDLDGDLDLYITGWFSDGIGGNRLFRNNGDETFADVTDMAGLDNLGIRGFTGRFTDMDGDRYPELLVTGDFGTARYYINDGDGTFTEYTQESGTGLDCNAMGTTTGDVNNDGRIDWYVTNIYNFQNPKLPCGNMLYLNLADHLYFEVADISGVNHGWFGWGTVAVDFDHDGWLDIAEVNGFPDDDLNQLWAGRPARMWFNDGDGTFTEQASTCNFISTTQGRGLINLDIENDGDQDLVILSAQSPNEPVLKTQLFRNDTVNTNRWLRLFLDTSQNRDLAPNGFGTHVQATVGADTYVRYLDGGSNYLSQSELSVHFGLGGAATVDELRITWSNGVETVMIGVPADQTMTVTAPPRPADLNVDLVVDTNDLLILLGQWGACPGCPGDIDGSGVVDLLDLLQMLGAWG